MRYFTDSPFERMMMQIPRHRQKSQPKPPPSRSRLCHGCPYVRSTPCMGVCYRELLRRK